MLKTLKRSHTSFSFAADASADESGSLSFVCEGEAESQRCFILLKGLKSKPPPLLQSKAEVPASDLLPLPSVFGLKLSSFPLIST